MMTNGRTPHRLVIAAEKYKKEKDYWIKKLSGQLIKTAFASDNPHAGEKEPVRGSYESRFPPTHLPGIIKLSNHSDLRLHIILISGLVVLLNQYTGKNDIIVGTPIFKQEVEGDFFNTCLPLRIQINEGMTFKELLLQVRQVLVEAVANQNYPVKLLPGQLDIRSAPGEFPLFDIAVVTGNIQDRKYIGDLNLGMIFFFLPTGESIEEVLYFNTLRYKYSTIKKIIIHFNRILEQVSGDVNLRVSYLQLLTCPKRDYYPLSAAQHQMFVLWQLDKNGIAYNMPVVLKIEGDFDRVRAEEGFRRLIERHEALRTVIKVVEGKLHQEINEEVEFKLRYREVEEPGIKAEIKEFIRPFDLSGAPLFRAGLVKLADREFILITDIHHIIADDTTIQIIVEEFFEIYQGGIQNLPPLRIQYKEYAMWQQEKFSRDELRSQEQYWLDRLSGEIPVLNLPFDYQRPAVQGFAGNTLNFPLSQSLRRSLQHLAVSKGTDLAAVLFAAFYILLRKHSGQEDIIVGIPVDLRNVRPDMHLQRIVGIFSNTLAVRMKIPGALRFHTFLNTLQENLLTAFANREYEFPYLVKTLNLKRDRSRNPLFDVMFYFNRRSIPSVEGLTLTPYLFENRKAEVDLSLYAAEIEDVIHVSLEYSSKLFKPGTIAALKIRYINILEEITGNPQVKISTLEMLSGEEKNRLLYEFNNTNAEFPRDKTLAGLFAEQVKKTPARTAAVFENRYLTYLELNRRSNRLANYLNAEVQIRPGSLVGMMLERSLELIIALFGILKAGGAYVPIDPGFPEKRQKTILEDTKLGVVISGKNHINILNRLQWECPGFHTYLCLDTPDVHGVDEIQKNELMDVKLWEYIGEQATDEISGGGFVSSYTGEPFSRKEVDELADNAYRKLQPFLHPRARVLEIGCAAGITMFKLVPRVGFFYGTDMSEVIIEKDRQRVHREKIKNIKLHAISAHEIDALEEKDFDIVILNSVIQAFHGLNYLRKVILKMIALCKDRAVLFLGDIMDPQRKTAMIRAMEDFNREHPGTRYKTKTDFSQELFVSGGFFQDLAVEIKEINQVLFSEKLHTIKNELTEFRYDAIIKIDKKTGSKTGPKVKQKYQHGHDVLKDFAVQAPGICPGPGDLAYVIYTSGSTGNPRGVMVEHRSLVNRLHWTQKKYPVGPGDTFLQKTPFTFDVSVWELTWWAMAGARICFLEPGGHKDPGIIVNTMARHRVTVVHFVPSMLRAFLEYTRNLEDLAPLASLKQVFSSGEALTPPLLNTFNRLLYDGNGTKLSNLYGPTEATIDVSYYDCSTGEDLEKIPIGKPIDNTRLYIVDKDQGLQPPGVRGELCISGIGLARGYLNSPPLTASHFAGNPFIEGEQFYRTGDLAKWLPEGNIEYCGRKDNQVKIRGVRIELDEIRTRLLTHEEILEAAVITKNEKNGDRFLCAFIVPAGAPGVKASQLKAYLSGILPDYMIPSFFLTIDKLPLTASGKVDTRTLQQMEINVNTGSDYKAPESKIEEKLVEIWEKILEVKGKIGTLDNFFDLGGHSLKATRIRSKIHKELGIDVPLQNIFKQPTIREIARYIGNDVNRDGFVSIPAAPKRNFYPASPAQKRMFVLTRFAPGSTAYNIPAVLRLQGNLNKERYITTFKALVKRHEAFRTRFEIVHKELVQRIFLDVDLSIQYMEAAEIEIQRIIKTFIRPFRLDIAPLLRVGLLKLQEKEHLLLIDMHHIIADGSSVVILVQEFSKIYNRKNPDPVKTRYNDYTIWLYQQLKSGMIKKQEEYWLNQFKKEIPPLNLPVDYPRTGEQGFEGKEMKFKIHRELTAGALRLANREQVTLYMLLLAVYNVLLYKYTGQEDIVVGFPIAGRPHADLENVVGMFVNTLPMRNFPQGSKTFAVLLREVKANALKAYENQLYQFEDLVEKLHIKREVGRNPLFDTMFGLVPVNLENIKIDGFNVSPVEFEYGTSKLDITVEFEIQDHQLVLAVDYAVKLYKPETIAAYIKDFKEILQQVNKDPFVQLNQVVVYQQQKRYPLSSAQERMYILHHMTGYANYNMPCAISISGEVDGERLENTFMKLIRRHEILRTSFELSDKEPVQVIHPEVPFTVTRDEIKEEDAGKRVKDFIRRFDLTQAPLLRVALLKVGHRKYILAIDMHHIAVDGFSHGVFLAEFMAIYSGKELPPLKFQYKDHSLWQSRFLASAEMKKQEEYWIKRFKENVPYLNLPTDYPRPPRLRFEGGSVPFSLGKELTARIKRCVLATRTTMYIVLLAAFNILLSKYSGQEDIVIGAPLIGRRHGDWENIIGMFVNTLPMRNRPQSGKSWNEFLGEVRENALDAFENQDYQFERLVMKLEAGNDPGRNPLYDVVFSFENTDLASGEILKADIPGLELKPYKINSNSAVFDIILVADDDGEKIRFNMDYRTCLFKEQTIRRMGRHFETILEEVTHNPGIKLAHIKMLSEEEEKQLKKKLGRWGKKILYKGSSEKSKKNEETAANFDF